MTPRVLVVRAGSILCGLPFARVRETMRPLPVKPVAGAPEFVDGLSIVRGVPTVVVDLRFLLSGAAPDDKARRWVLMAMDGGRRIALAADAVLGVQEIDPAILREVPSILRSCAREAVQAVGVLDEELFALLNETPVLPEEVWKAAEAAGRPARGVGP